MQSSLDPAGAHAHQIDRLWWLFFGIAAFVFVVVIGLLLASLRRSSWSRTSEPGADRRTHLAIAGGVIATVVLLFVMFTATLLVARSTSELEPGVLTIRVMGKMWWWEVTYLHDDKRQQFTTANELRIPVGHPVRVELVSDNVIHSFWVPRLNGKVDLIPGRKNTLILEATEPGTFRGQCAEFCGLQHAKMALYVVAMEPRDFTDWLQRQRAPAKEPTDPVAQRGKEVFAASDCARCHTIRGVSTATEEGPQLTHLASRKSLGAGTVPNRRGYLSGWIANPQALKPGNLMPVVPLPPEDLRSLVHYLETLE